MNRQFDLRPRPAGGRVATRTAPPARMVLCLRPSPGSAAAGSEPVVGERLLIGSDPHCDVCIAGQEIPDLHTILAVDGHAAWADVVIAEPPLLVNGVETEVCQLHDGDVIEIGAARFEVRFSPATLPSAALRAWGVFDSPEECDMDDMRQLSAEDLVDLIEQEEAQITAFEAGQLRGLRALARAAGVRPAPTVALHQPAMEAEETAEDDLARQMEQLSDQLDRLAGRMAVRSEELADREARIREAIDGLSDVQRQLDERLNALRTAANEETRPMRRAA